MKKPAICIAIFVTIMSILSPCVYADYDYADSPEFQLNLLSLPLGGAYDYADSSQFSLDLYPVNRGWADSSSFSFDWLANCEPVYGPVQYPDPAEHNDFLVQLDGSGNWVSVFSLPAIDDTVIIINHGWNSSPDGMLELAVQIASEVPVAYIYSWDWDDNPDKKSGANPNGKDILGDLVGLACDTGSLACLLADDSFVYEVETARNNAHKHGIQLGEKLVEYGISSSQHKIHMIGHSFGGIVCAEAADKLYKNSGSKIKQLTTLDTPALLWPYAIGAVKPKHFERVEVLYYNELIPLAGTGGPIWWDTDNVTNLNLNPIHYFFPLHTKVVDWYTKSADSTQLNCENDPYGFGWSFAYSPNNPYWDITGSQRELELGGEGCLITWAEVGKAVADAVIDTVKEDFASAAEWTGNKAVVVMDNIGNVVNSAVKLTVTTGLVLPLGQSQMMTMATADSPAEPNEAYIYRQIEVPADAEQVVFDMRFESVGIGDILTLSIGTDVLITIDAEAAGLSDTYSMSYPASIRDYAGQTVLLQLMLRPTGEGTTSVLIDNIRFIKLTIPGDFDGDRAVNILDLSILANQWLLPPSEPSADIAPAPAGDNMVNMQDFLILAENWQIDISGGD